MTCQNIYCSLIRYPSNCFYKGSKEDPFLMIRIRFILMNRGKKDGLSNFQGIRIVNFKVTVWDLAINNLNDDRYTYTEIYVNSYLNK